MSYYYSHRPSTHWVIQHWASSDNAYKLNGCRLKTYLYHSNTFVKTGPTYKVNYRLVMNYSKAVTTFELFYQMSSNHLCVKNWSPVPVEIMERMFKKEDGGWDFCTLYNSDEKWKENTKVEVVDGHFLFKYDTEWLRYKMGAISQDTLTYSVPGKLIYELDTNLGIALAYPENKYTLADTVTIDDALRRIRSVEWAIPDEVEENRNDPPRIARLRERLAKAKADLEQYEQGYQRILEGAAEAMNLLSSKYHVDIEV